MANIYDSTLSYRLVKSYVTFTFKRFYSEYIVIGKENIPTDCPLIFAPNHTNALMDALAVHSIVSTKTPLIFLARSDIFKNSTAAKLLKFFRIMPAFRMRDGVENLSKNSEVFNRCVEVLNHNKALGIMPEGNQEIERKIRPLAKGIFRIAFAAQQKQGSTANVKIIPVGIDYGDIEKFWKHLIINIGEPIEVSDYMTEYAINPAVATNQIRERLSADLCELSLNLATEKYYDCFETVTEVANSAYLDKLDLPNNTKSRFIARQKIAEKLVSIEKNEPEKVELVNALCQQYKRAVESLKLKDWVFNQKQISYVKLLIEITIQTITFPVFVCGLVLNFLPFFTPVYLRKNVFKAKFSGFYSSLQYGLGILTFPLFYILQTTIFHSLTNSTWWITLIFFFIQYPLGKFAIKWNSVNKKLIATYRFKKYKKSKVDLVKQAKTKRDQLIQHILN